MIGSLGAVKALEADENKTLRKDRVWVYSVYESYTLSGGESLKDMEVRYDRTEEINGRPYLIYTSSYGHEFALREEHGKIFRHYFDESLDSGDEKPLPADEHLIYDFNLGKGDSFDGIMTRLDVWDLERYPDYSTAETTYTIADTQALELSDVELKVQWLNGSYLNSNCEYRIVEGVGPFDLGMLAAMMYGPFKAGVGYREHEVDFERLEDMEGNVILTREDVENAIREARIREVQNGHPASNGKIYDLNGREIRNPEPGTVYIQGGRKMSRVRH